jgi:hypothetical protein
MMNYINTVQNPQSGSQCPVGHASLTGKRINRDVYCTKDGLLIHADLNAASNILRKVADRIFSNSGIAKLAFEIIKRGALTHPKRYDIFINLKRSYRKQTTSGSVS